MGEKKNFHLYKVQRKIDIQIHGGSVFIVEGKIVISIY